MNPTWDAILPEYITYWNSVGLEKFVRIFWYFIIFELTRYISIDFVIAFIFKIKSKSRNQKWQLARDKLYAENPLISIIIPGKNEGPHLFKLTKSLAEANI